MKKVCLSVSPSGACRIDGGPSPRTQKSPRRIDGGPLSVLHLEGKAVRALVLSGVCLVCADADAVKAAEILAAAVMLAVRDRAFYTFICSFGAHNIYLRSDYCGILRDNIISRTELFIRL